VALLTEKGGKVEAVVKASISKYILAVITLDAALVGSGGAPVFIARDRVEQDRIATYLAGLPKGGP